MFNLSAALIPEERADRNALRNKFQKVTRKCSVLPENSPNVGKRVELLSAVQTQRNEMEAKFNDEMIALEAKYLNLYQPLYTNRYEIVNGVVDVEGDTSDKSAGLSTLHAEKGVADFWLTAMKNNKDLAKQIKERDEGALKYLKDIKWSKIDGPKRFGFKLEFFFDTNAYFKNSVLTKIYHMIDGDKSVPEKAIGTEIHWYPGNVLTQKFVKKRKRKSTRIETKKCPSFFNFFSPPQDPMDEYDFDEYDEKTFLNSLDLDYEIGSTIREKIIPHAVSWFTGEIIEKVCFLDDPDDDDDEDDTDFDYDYDDDEEEGEIPPVVYGGLAWGDWGKGSVWKRSSPGWRKGSVWRSSSPDWGKRNVWKTSSI